MEKVRFGFSVGRICGQRNDDLYQKNAEGEGEKSRGNKLCFLNLSNMLFCRFSDISHIGMYFFNKKYCIFLSAMV